MRKIPILLVTALVAAPAAAGAQSAQATAARDAVEARAGQQQQPPPPPPVPPSRPRPGQRVTVGRDHDGREEQRETFTKTVKLGASGVLDVSNLSGNIDIKRGGGAEAVIEVTKIARARTQEAAREMLPMVRVEITPRPERAEIRTIYDMGEPHEPGRGRNINVSVNYTITAPKDTRIRAVTLSGNLTATDMQGELSLVTTSGNVAITNASRVTAAKSTSGNVELTNINSDVALDAATVSGNVIARSVKARRITIGTVSGQVIVQDVQTERLSAGTFSGNVDFSGVLAKGGRYDLKSHSGNVRIAVAEGSGFEVEANSWSGTVHSAFAIGGSDGEPQRGRRKIIRGIVGDGSAVVNITTFSGDVHLVKR